MFKIRFLSCGVSGLVLLLECVPIYSQHSAPISNRHSHTIESSRWNSYSDTQSARTPYMHSADYSLLSLLQERVVDAEPQVYSVSCYGAELAPMDNGGIVRCPRRIAGGDHDSFGEGEDGEKLPEVGTTKNNPTPIGDVPIAMLICTALSYMSYQYHKTYNKLRIGKK